MHSSPRSHTSLTLGFALLTLLFLPVTAWAQTVVTVAMEPENQWRYWSFLAEKEASPLEITNMTSLSANRPVAELIIVQQALAAAGMPVQLKFISVPNPARARMMIRNGHTAMSGVTFFSKAITKDVHMSSALIPTGKFVKGVYAMESHPIRKNVQKLSDLQQYRAISSTGWKVDWLTLTRMNLNELRSVPRYGMMFNLVASGKVDFAVLEFPLHEDLVTSHNNIHLFPVPGVKIALDDSRHMTVSRSHPLGASLFKALEAGLKILRKKGTIERFYTEVGFYNDEVKDWVILNHPM